MLLLGPSRKDGLSIVTHGTISSSRPLEQGRAQRMNKGDQKEAKKAKRGKARKARVGSEKIACMIGSEGGSQGGRGEINMAPVTHPTGTTTNPARSNTTQPCTLCKTIAPVAPNLGVVWQPTPTQLEHFAARLKRRHQACHRKNTILTDFHRLADAQVPCSRLPFLHT